jgi:hypothetical protein
MFSEITKQFGERAMTKDVDEVYYPAPKGWICPVCGRGLAPWTSECPCYQANYRRYTVSNTTFVCKDEHQETEKKGSQ